MACLRGDPRTRVLGSAVRTGSADRGLDQHETGRQDETDSKCTAWGQPGGSVSVRVSMPMAVPLVRVVMVVGVRHAVWIDSGRE